MKDKMRIHKHRVLGSPTITNMKKKNIPLPIFLKVLSLRSRRHADADRANSVVDERIQRMQPGR